MTVGNVISGLAACSCRGMHCSLPRKQDVTYQCPVSLCYQTAMTYRLVSAFMGELCPRGSESSDLEVETMVTRQGLGWTWTKIKMTTN
jgi:hypothetical protein